jgi:uncharacterized protein YkwD
MVTVMPITSPLSRRPAGSLLLVAFLAVGPASAIVDDGHASPIGRPADRRSPAGVEEALLLSLNAERTSRGLPALRLSADLARLAREHSAEMAASGNLIHDSAGGKPLHDRLTGASLSFTADAENIARIDHCDPARLHRSFMGSPSHRGNILDPRFDEVGIGVAFGGGNVCYVTEDFIRTAPGSGPGPDGLSPRPGT